MTMHCFIEPVDVLYLRGNRLFGDPGSHGESLMPPSPSVTAGALRSWLLAEDGVDFGDFAKGRIRHPAIGTPDQPGAFRVSAFHLARERDGQVQTLHPPPADLDLRLEAQGPIATRLQPTWIDPRLGTSAPLTALPVLAARDRYKPASGWWLTRDGWGCYLRGEPIPASAWVAADDLWQTDFRVGVGLDAGRGRADDGKLFSMQAVVLNDGLGPRAAQGRVGFVASVVGADLPSRGAIRFGGDGRAATVRLVSIEPLPFDYEAVCRERQCRMVLLTPGLFAEGWLPDGALRDVDGAVRFELCGVRARIIAAAVPRPDVVSGFDLARWQPKPAERAAPAGSVYWLTDLDATPDALRKLAETGLWADEAHHASRRAEGFNQCAIATY